MRVSGYGKVGDERRLAYDSSVFGEGDDLWRSFGQGPEVFASVCNMWEQ